MYMYMYLDIDWGYGYFDVMVFEKWISDSYTWNISSSNSNPVTWRSKYSKMKIKNNITRNSDADSLLQRTSFPRSSELGAGTFGKMKHLRMSNTVLL